MTISSTTNRVSYAGNGSTTIFSFPYKFLANSDLIVIEVTDSTGAEVIKTITTHYTVSGAGESIGGSVTMLVAPALGKTLVIVRSPALTQGLDLVENDSLPAESVEEALDRSTMIHQRTRELVDRSVSLPDGFTDTFDPSLPALMADNPGATIIINAAGDGFKIGPLADEIEDAQADADAAAASAAAASASASSASSSASAAAASAAAAAVGTFTGALLLPHISTPSTPAASYDKLYFKSDNKLYFLNPSGTESLVVNNAEVIAKVLTGYTSGAGTVASTDTILQGIQKLNGNAVLANSSNQIRNLGIAFSVGASAATIAIKTAAGSDASSTDFVSIGFRNATSANGQYSIVNITGALSMTLSSGSTLGQISAQASYMFVYLINNSGTAEVAVSASLYDDGSIVSTTAEGGAGAADSATAIYSTTARSNVALRLVGRILNTQTTAGTWTSTPTQISLTPFTNIIRYQQKSLGSTINTTGVMSDVTFTGLRVGYLYRVSCVFYGDHANTLDNRKRYQIQARMNGSGVGIVLQSKSRAAGASAIEFSATTSETFIVTGAGNGTLDFNVADLSNMEITSGTVFVEELIGYTSTSIW